MRSQREISLVLGLVAQGLSDSQIARLTAIPRPTVRDWRRGRLPIHPDDGSPCGGHQHLPLCEAQYAYLLGLYLGDGCISPARSPGVWLLRISADSKYPGIIAECCRALEAIFPRKHAHRLAVPNSACVVISMYSKHWTCLFPQHGAGRKHLRPIKLVDWQREIVDRHHGSLLRGLIHSDGCRITARERKAGRVREAPRYLFSNKSEDIKALFCESCDALGIRWTRPSSREVAIYRLASVARMDEFVGPKT